MVQVGYGYYGQCYELKRKKQNELLPIYPEMKEMSPKRKNGELEDILGSGKESIYMKSKLNGVIEPGAKGIKLK